MKGDLRRRNIMCLMKRMIIDSIDSISTFEGCDV